MPITDQQVVSPEQVASFVDQGFLVVAGLVSPELVETIRDDAARFARGEYPVSNLPADGRLLAIHFPHWVSPVAASMVTHPGIAGVVSAVAGAHLAHWDGRVKCMQSMLFLKPPGLQGQAWHQDERYIPTRDRSLIGAWIALDDATVENGCLWVIPGSHRQGVIHPTRDHGRPDEFDPSDEAHGFDATAAVPVEVAAGDVVFFNGYLLHRSLKNRSSGTRRSLVNHYMSSASLLPWMMKGINVATADSRTVIPVIGDDPHAWRGYTDPPSEVFVRPHAGAWGSPDPLHVDTSIVISAPIDVVWDVLVDASGHGAWNDLFDRLDGENVVGSTITVTARPTGATGPVSYPVDVVTVDAPSVLIWEGGLPDRSRFRGDHRWELTADGALTIVRHHEHFSGSEAEAVLDQRRDAIRADFERFNTCLRDEAERRVAQGQVAPGGVARA